MVGRVPEWTKGTDCKSVIRGFESHRGLLTIGSGACTRLVSRLEHRFGPLLGDTSPRRPWFHASPRVTPNWAFC